MPTFRSLESPCHAIVIVEIKGGKGVGGDGTDEGVAISVVVGLGETVGVVVLVGGDADVCAIRATSLIVSDS